MHQGRVFGWVSAFTKQIILIVFLGSGFVSGQASGQTGVSETLTGGGELQVNTYTTNDQRRPEVAIDADGDFVVVWQSNLQEEGSYLVGEGIFAQRFDSLGDAVGSEFQVNTYTTGDQNIVGVAMDDAGGFVVVWNDLFQEGSSAGIFGRRYSSSGSSLGGEFLINAYTTSLQDNSRVAMDADGDFVVVWQSFGQDGSNVGIFGRLFDRFGDAVGVDFQVNAFTTGSQSLPGLAMGADGGFVVVWASAQGGAYRDIFARRYSSSGSQVGGEFQVNTTTLGRQWLPDVAMDEDGGFVVVWASDGQDGSGFGVFGQRFASTGAPVGGEFQVNTATAYRQSDPDVAMRSDGEFVVVWSSYQEAGAGTFAASDLDVQGQRFSSSGEPLGGEFRVNSSTDYPQWLPAVAMDDTGVFVVAWEDLGDPGDGDGFGVFANRYCGDAYATPDRLWSPNHDLVTVEVLSLSGATIVIEGVRQDEPVGKKIPDCVLLADDRVDLRAEREGSGNGRVYHVFYTALGTGGEVCAGELRVGVLDNNGSGGEPIDDGALFESCG